MKIKKQFETLNKHRLKQNPLEKKFVKAWRAFNTNPAYPNAYPDFKTLEMLLGFPPTDLQYRIAETLIQWLGSPVGSKFVNEVNGKGK